MSSNHAQHTKVVKFRLAFTCSLLALALLLTGCLEQSQTTRIPSGALSNFFLHLYAGELDDARAYFAPGLVTPSAELDASIKEAADRLRRYEIQRKKSRTEELGGGQIRQTLSGRIRVRVPTGQPTPEPEEGWQEADILSARMVERGPGWRILEFDVDCCPSR